MSDKTVEKKDRVVVRSAGDSGDGMQVVGSRFTDETAVAGNDLATLPDFPAEIRAPAGTPHGVSAFQIHFASRDILTPGDHPNVLVAMNPAALITQVGSLEGGGTIIVNEDGFTDPNLKKAGYESNPLEDGSLDGYQVFRGPVTTLTARRPIRQQRAPRLLRAQPAHPALGAAAHPPPPYALPGAHDPGGGRDRRREHGARRRLRRPARGHGHARARHGPEGRDRRPR